MFFLILAHGVYQKYTIVNLKKDNTTLSQQIENYKTKLDDLAKKTTELEDSLGQAQEKAKKVRVVTKKVVEVVTKEAAPTSCEDTRQYLIDAAKETK